MKTILAFAATVSTAILATIHATPESPPAPQVFAAVAAAKQSAPPQSPAWRLRIGSSDKTQNVYPILNPDATEAWGIAPYARRVYGGRPGDGTPDQGRRLRELSYVWHLSRYGDYYVAALNPPEGERILWQIPASEWNPSGPNVLTCSDPGIPTLTAEK